MPDVNVLVYAHRRDEPTHEAYRAWLEDLVNAGEPFALSVLVAAAFLRIATNRRIYEEPTPLPVAIAAMESLWQHENCRLACPGQGHLERLASLCRATGATGKAVADAQHAALALEHGCQWVTRDADFARFESSGLRWTHLRF